MSFYMLQVESDESATEGMKLVESLKLGTPPPLSFSPTPLHKKTNRRIFKYEEKMKCEVFLLFLTVGF